MQKKIKIIKYTTQEFTRRLFIYIYFQNSSIFNRKLLFCDVRDKSNLDLFSLIFWKIFALIEVKPGASTRDLILSSLSCIKYWSFHGKI